MLNYHELLQSTFICTYIFLYVQIMMMQMITPILKKILIYAGVIESKNPNQRHNYLQTFYL